MFDDNKLAVTAQSTPPIDHVAAGGRHDRLSALPTDIDSLAGAGSAEVFNHRPTRRPGP